MTESILNALYGGALIGLAASILMLFNGRVAGISGVLGGLLPPVSALANWRRSFLTGLLLGGLAVFLMLPEAVQPPTGRSTVHLILAGLLVGYGTQLGNGCTSGHGVCGISRLSTRSITATMIFITTGVLTAIVVRLFGTVS